MNTNGQKKVLSKMKNGMTINQIAIAINCSNNKGDVTNMVKNLVEKGQLKRDWNDYGDPIYYKVN